MLLRYSLSLGAEAGTDCFCFAGQGVAEVPVILFDGEEE